MAMGRMMKGCGQTRDYAPAIIASVGAASGAVAMVHTMARHASAVGPTVSSATAAVVGEGMEKTLYSHAFTHPASLCTHIHLYLLYDYRGEHGCLVE